MDSTSQAQLVEWLIWQRACRRRTASGSRPSAPEPFWASFFDATQALAVFDEPRALELLERAERECPDDERVRAALDETLGETRFLLNDYAAAQERLHRAAASWGALGERLHEAEARSWAGASLVQQGRYQDGYELLAAAIDDFARLGRPARAARALNYLAVTHEELGDYPRAFDVYERALAAAVEDGDDDMQGRVLANQGEAFVAQGRPEQGLPVLGRAVEVLKRVGAHWHYGWCQLAIGRIHLAQGELSRALGLYQEALEAVEKGHSPRARLEVYAGLGEFHSTQGQHREAFDWLGRALSIAEGLGIQREQFKTHRLLADAHKRAGDFEKALAHHERFHQLRAEVFDQLARERVATLKVEFELQRVREAHERERQAHRELTDAYARLEEKAQQLSALSVRDGLTGLYNRRHFDEVLALELARARTLGLTLTLVLADLDSFKQINDQHSHVTGDSVLRTVAAMLGRELRQSDFAARYGGEEFALILGQTSLEGGRIVGEKVRQAVARADWSKLVPGRAVTLSLGVAEWNSHETPVQLIRRADGALYAAKNAGRNCVRLG